MTTELGGGYRFNFDEVGCSEYGCDQLGIDPAGSDPISLGAVPGAFIDDHKTENTGIVDSKQGMFGRFPDTRDLIHDSKLDHFSGQPGRYLRDPKTELVYDRKTSQFGTFGFEDPKLGNFGFEDKKLGHFGGEMFLLLNGLQVESQVPYEEGHTVHIYIATSKPQQGNDVKSAVESKAKEVLQGQGYTLTSSLQSAYEPQPGVPAFAIPLPGHYHLWQVRVHVAETAGERAVREAAEAAAAESLAALQTSLTAISRELAAERKDSGSRADDALLSRIFSSGASRGGGAPSDNELALEAQVAELMAEIEALMQLVEITTLVGPAPEEPLMSVEEHAAADAAAVAEAEAVASEQGYILPGYSYIDPATGQGALVPNGYIFDLYTGVLVEVRGMTPGGQGQGRRRDNRGYHQTPPNVAQHPWQQQQQPWQQNQGGYAPASDGYWPDQSSIDDTWWFGAEPHPAINVD